MAAPTSGLSVQDFFNGLNRDRMDLVDQFYAEDSLFEDPVVRIQGRQEIRKYYQHLYDNVKSIRFDFKSELVQGDERVALWTMRLEHPRLNGGKPVVVEGNSYFKFSKGQAVYHRDYFDMGAFIYENVPVLGSVIGFIKSKMRQN
jgi:ketosteroid isomerase-like protein